MGESHLAGTEYRDSTRKEVALEQGLENLIGKRWHVSLKNDEITVLVEAEIAVSEIIRRENRIETGHLTLDDIYYQIINDKDLKIFFPLVQFQGLEQYTGYCNFKFDTYWWMFRLITR